MCFWIVDFQIPPQLVSQHASSGGSINMNHAVNVGTMPGGKGFPMSNNQKNQMQAARVNGMLLLWHK